MSASISSSSATILAPGWAAVACAARSAERVRIARSSRPATDSTSGA